MTETRETVEPALSAEEWKRDAARSEVERWQRIHHFAIYGMLQQAAAIALYGQPFGFSAEDVALIREAIIEEPRWECSVIDKAQTARLHAIADRIAALLP